MSGAPLAALTSLTRLRITVSWDRQSPATAVDIAAFMRLPGLVDLDISLGELQVWTRPF